MFDGGNPACFNVYCNIIRPKVLVSEVMQDFYHQPFRDVRSYLLLGSFFPVFI